MERSRVVDAVDVAVVTNREGDNEVADRRDKDPPVLLLQLLLILRLPVVRTAVDAGLLNRWWRRVNADAAKEDKRRVLVATAVVDTST